jgi:hypothetical protein
MSGLSDKIARASYRGVLCKPLLQGEDYVGLKSRSLRQCHSDRRVERRVAQRQ